MSNSYEEFFNSFEDFKLAVYNGQVRLALEHLVPVLETMVDILSDDEQQEEKTEQNAAIPTPAPIAKEEVASVEEVKVEDVKSEKAPAKKNTKEQE
jgi:hypothetical protein